MKYSCINIQPRFYEFDTYGIVNNMFYYSWFELGRLRIAQQAELDNCINSTEYKFVVLKSSAEYLFPVRPNDEIACESCIKQVVGSKLVFQHSIVNKINGRKYAEGSSEVAVVKNDKLLLKLPKEINEKINNYIVNIQKGIN